MPELPSKLCKGAGIPPYVDALVMQALRKASAPLVQDWLKKAGPDGAALVKALR